MTKGDDFIKNFVLVIDEHNFKVGDEIKFFGNVIFSYKINAIKKWKNETILSVKPIDKAFNDCNTLLLTRYQKIYKRVLK